MIETWQEWRPNKRFCDSYNLVLISAHINSYRFMCLCLEKEMMHMRTIARD
jgi:hypothetical protein